MRLYGIYSGPDCCYQGGPFGPLSTHCIPTWTLRVPSKKATWRDSVKEVAPLEVHRQVGAPQIFSKIWAFEGSYEDIKVWGSGTLTRKFGREALEFRCWGVRILV